MVEADLRGWLPVMGGVLPERKGYAFRQCSNPGRLGQRFIGEWPQCLNQLKTCLINSINLLSRVH
jgi:hypothetical protein